MKKLFRRILVCGMIWVFTSSLALAQEAVETINVMYIANSGYHPDELQMLQKVFRDLTGIEVNVDYINYEDQYEKIIEDATTYDVVSLDQIWLADLVLKGILAPLDEYMTKRMRRDITSVVLKAFHYQKHTWAFPFLANFQMLYYNEKILEEAGFTSPPDSLETLVKQMKAIKEQEILEYPWTDSWSQGEGLINEYIWLTGAFGGEIFDAEGKPIFDQEPGVMALQFMLMLLKEQLAHPKILTNDEIAARDDFLSGQAAFTSNWLFLGGFLDDPALSDIVEEGKMSVLPASGNVSTKTSSVGAFQGVAITAASEKKEAAWKWIAFLTSPLVQRAFLFEMPIWKSVQTSQDAERADPMMVIKREQLANVHHRPNIPNYPQVSSILQKYISLTLKGRMKPDAALKRAKEEIEPLLE